MIHIDTIQLKNLLVLLIIPIYLAPFIVLWNVYMFYSFLYWSWVNCLWLMILSYNIMAYYIVVKRNPYFLARKCNKYIHWVFNILNSSLFLIYLQDINILSSVFYLILLILFMSCYNTKTAYPGVLVYKHSSFLSLLFRDPIKFIIYIVSIIIIKHLLLDDVVLSIIWHSSKCEQFTLSYSFIYEQFIYYLFYLEPFTVIFTFFLVLFTNKSYLIINFEYIRGDFGKSFSEMKYFYSARMLFDTYYVTSLNFFVHIIHFFVHIVSFSI